MAVGANSYGTATDVAALTWAWVTETGAYTTTTLPSLAQVEGWIDQVSAIMNTSLAGNGFTIPVTQADSVLAVKNVVIGYVAEMTNYANSTGRFFTERALASGISPFEVIRREISSWVESFATGLEVIGAARPSSFSEGIAFREFDESGESTVPMFQRKAFGNKFDNWDTNGT